MPTPRNASGSLGKKPPKKNEMVRSLQKMKKTPGQYLKDNLKTLIKESKKLKKK